MTSSNRPKNALSHGVYANDVVLPWENEQDFKYLLESIRAEFCPSGASEEEVVFDIVASEKGPKAQNVRRVRAT